MKVQITQRYVFHKVGTIEIEVNKEDYNKYFLENKGYHSIDDYLLENESLWVERIDQATDSSEFEFGFGCYNGFNEEGSESETRYNCYELEQGGHL